MSRDSSLYLSDIVEAILAIKSYLGGSRASAVLLSHPMARDAVVRNIEIIGEAVKRLPPELTSRHPEIDWNGWARLRDVLAHQYFGVDVDLLADAVDEELPALERVVAMLLTG
jgi:uncharacterized protein with HEPN domain